MNLGPADFRFLAAWIQGVDVRVAWERYCAHRGGGDLRRIRTHVRSMLDQLAATARRSGDAATAALLRRDPGRLNLPAPPLSSSTSAGPGLRVPTLDEFAASLDPPDFYRQAELLELWTERFGRRATAAPGQGREAPHLRAAKRRGRLITRQLDALRNLEHLAVSRPQPGDPAGAWLDAAVATRLQAVGIARLGELLDFVNRHGYRWYTKVPRIGEEGAQRLGRWLREQEASLGVLRITAMVPRAQWPATVMTPLASEGVVPIERLVVPPGLSGADWGTPGSNRAPHARCRIPAHHDLGAVQAWLELRRPVDGNGNANTWRAYRKEAERFLLWAVFERHKPLSALDGTDCLAYRRFLAAPAPHWIGTKASPRWSPHWRPFEGPLSPRSRRMAEVIVSAMCGWLVDVRYLDSNPWAALPSLGRAGEMSELRSLSDTEWQLVDSWLHGLPRTPANERLGTMLRFALLTGLREAELAAARVGWLLPENGEGGEPAWTLRVIGKGNKVREVPLMRRAAQLLAAHLVFKGVLWEAGGQGLGTSAMHPGAMDLGALDLREADPALPLFSGLKDPARPMAPARVYELVKDALERCANAVEATVPYAARRIRRASPHWLRHTHGRKFVEGGGDRGVLRDNLGHASLATTGIYDRSDVRRRRAEMEKALGST